MIKLSGARDGSDSSILYGLQTVDIITRQTRKHHIACSNRAARKQSVTSIVRAWLDKLLRICRRTPKQVDVRWLMWFLIDIVASRYSPRFFTVATGLMSSRPMMGLLVGTWWRRPNEEHHMSSVFGVLSWSRFNDIQLATSARQISMRRQRDCGSDGSHEPTIWASSA